MNEDLEKEIKRFEKKLSKFLIKSVGKIKTIKTPSSEQRENIKWYEIYLKRAQGHIRELIENNEILKVAMSKNEGEEE